MTGRSEGGKKLRLALFASGSGTNAEAIVRACRQGDSGPLPMVEPVIVICDKPQAQVLERTQSLSVPSRVFPAKDYPDRKSHEEAILGTLRALDVDVICLAGYMRLIGKTLIDAFPWKILNIHPSLLPSFPGMSAHRDAIEYGVRYTGVTVHFVDEGMDTGPILVQKVEPVRQDDTEVSLADRMRPLEHAAYIEALSLLASGSVSVVGRRVFF